MLHPPMWPKEGLESDQYMHQPCFPNWEVRSVSLFSVPIPLLLTKDFFSSYTFPFLCSVPGSPINPKLNLTLKEVNKMQFLKTTSERWHFVKMRFWPWFLEYESPRGSQGWALFYILITKNGGNPHVNIQSIMLSFNSTTKLDLTQTTSWNGLIEDID